jgi:hypothetical protein
VALVHVITHESDLLDHLLHDQCHGTNTDDHMNEFLQRDAPLTGREHGTSC